MTKLDFPDTPSTGAQYGSSGTVWRWDGTRWGSTAGAAGARGRVAYGQVTTQQGGIGNALLGLTGLIAQWTADPSRTYRVTAFDTFLSTVNQGVGEMRIVNAVGSKLTGAAALNLQVTYGSPIYCSVVLTGLSGAQTCSVQAVAIGAHTMTSAPDPTFPAYILVEDITYEAGSGGQAYSDRYPRGTKMYVARATSVGMANARTEIFNVNVPFEANRLYKLTAVALLFGNQAGRGMLEIHHYNVTTLQQAIGAVLPAGSGNDNTFICQAIHYVTTAQTVNLNVTCAPGGGLGGAQQVGMTAAAVAPASFTVEDIGAV